MTAFFLFCIRDRCSLNSNRNESVWTFSIPHHWKQSQVRTGTTWQRIGKDSLGSTQPFFRYMLNIIWFFFPSTEESILHAERRSNKWSQSCVPLASVYSLTLWIFSCILRIQVHFKHKGCINPDLFFLFVVSVKVYQVSEMETCSDALLKIQKQNFLKHPLIGYRSPSIVTNTLLSI